MTDRTATLLAELVELQKRQVANQESMMALQEQVAARQQEAIRRQQEAIRRQRKFNRSMWIFTGVLVAMMFVVPVLNFFARAGR